MEKVFTLMSKSVRPVSENKVSSSSCRLSRFKYRRVTFCLTDGFGGFGAALSAAEASGLLVPCEVMVDMVLVRELGLLVS